MDKRLFSFICLALVLILASELHGKTITIQVDFDDLMKFINGLGGERTFRKFAKQVISKPDITKGLYNNPYHPEDDISNVLEVKIDTNYVKSSLSNKKLAVKKEDERKNENKVDAKIETDNYKFMSKPVMEDDLTDIAEEVKKQQDKIKNDDPAETRDDKYFNKMQRRFVLKSNG